MKQQKRRDQGFTLIELTAALFLVTAGIFGAIQVYLMSMEATRALEEYAVAQRVICAQMGALRALPPDVLSEGEGQPFEAPSPELEKLMNAAGTTDIVAAADVAGLYEVRVRIAWTGQHGRRIEKELVTYMAAQELPAERAASETEVTDASAQ
jgi:prepilin-type N-terminal cleavage/methylation domain-containing protein